MTRGLLRPSFLRRALAVVAALDLVSFFFFIGDARAVALDHRIGLDAFTALLSQPNVRGGVVLIGVLGAFEFGRKPGCIWGGLLSLGALTLFSTVHAELFGSPWRHLYYSGVCLLGWLLGLAVSRRRGAPADESYAHIGSMALLGTAYFNAGISKLAYGGMDWLSGAPIQAIVVAQDGLVQDSILSIYRSWVVMTPGVAGLFSVATLVFELAAPLMIVGTRTRLIVALSLLGLHLNILLLTHILYWESMVLLLLFGLSSDGPDGETAAVLDLNDRTFVTAAVVLAVCAVAAVGHQSWRFAHLQAAHAAANRGAPVMPTPASVPAVMVLGPFAVGQAVASSWSVDSLTISDRGFIVALSGQPGRVAFEITCASSPFQSPFDLGPAHMFYSSTLEPQSFEVVGQGVRERIRKAAEGRDLCETLARWRTAAQAAQSG